MGIEVALCGDGRQGQADIGRGRNSSRRQAGLKGADVLVTRDPGDNSVIWRTGICFALLGLQVLTAAPNADPFAFFQPSVTVGLDDRRQLARGDPSASVLSSKGLDIAVFAAIPVNIDGDRLVAWVRQIGEWKKSSYVLAIGRVSNPPRMDDLAVLALDDDELSEIRACRPASCALKLAATEMTQIQKAAAEAGDNWKEAVQQGFRRVVLQRIETYLANGHVAPYEDQSRQVWPATKFALLVEHTPFLAERVPQFAAHLRGYPDRAASEVESFLYWSKERIARRAVISVTHVNILRSHDAGLPDALVAGKEIFATHYVNASLGLTGILRGAAGGPNYLVYLNRTEVDMLSGMFGKLIRWGLQRRLRAESADVLRGLRRKLESGEPPTADAKASQRDVHPSAPGLSRVPALTGVVLQE